MIQVVHKIVGIENFKLKCMPKETKLFVLVHILIVLTIAPVTQMYNTFSELMLY